MHRKASRPSDRKPRRSFNFEALEPRQMLSANTNVTVQGPVAPPTGPIATPALTVAAPPGVLTTTYTGPYTPAQIRSIYGFDKLSLNGAGTTIAIVDAYDDPTIAQDLHTFDVEFGLADPTLTIHKQSGNDNTFNASWATEVALDVEWAHAIAPAANILLCEASSSSTDDLLSMVDYARNAPGVSVVSMSFGGREFEASWNPSSWFDENQTDYDSNLFTTPQGHRPVSFIAAAGDVGSIVAYPSTSPNVLAVGGTVITANESLATVSKATAGSATATPAAAHTPSNFQPMSYDSETAWINGGGGFSGVESRPAYQNGFNSNPMRSVPDVAYGATGFWIYNSSGGGWGGIGGTSAGAPQWAGLIALANQGRAQLGGDTLSNTVADIYQLPATDFHDITTGSTGVYKATVGFDQTTGRGTPIANLLVNDLIHTEFLPPPPTINPIGAGSIGNSNATTGFTNMVATTTPVTTTPVTTKPTTTSTTMSAAAFDATRTAGVADSPFNSRIGHTARATMLRASDAADRLFDALFGLG